MIIHRRREATAQELPSGYTIANYRIECVLGLGGMGAVYEATQLSLKRRVALKIIAAGVPLSATVTERFRREGQLQATIDHPHVLPVYEAGESDGRLFIAMRLVRGPTLKRLASSRDLDPERGVRMLGDVAHALDAAHAARLVHRDVKPQNVLVDHGDFAYLADFGLSRVPDESTLTRPGQLLGSVSYMSPEQVRGERATEASDVYSFTCMAYECLVGMVPFPRDSDHAVLHAHVWDPAPRPSDIDPQLSADVDEAIARGMAKAPEERPASAFSVVRELSSALGLDLEVPSEDPRTSEDLVAGSSSTQLSMPVEIRRPRRVVGALTPLLAAAALALGAAGGYVLAREPLDGKSDKPATGVADQGRHSSADARLAASLSSGFSALNASVTPLERALARARTPRAQAAAFAALGNAYRRALSDVAPARAPAQARPAVGAVRASVAGIAASYGRLAGAARHGRKGAYNSARSELRRRSQDLDAALARLQQLGYRLS